MTDTEGTKLTVGRLGRDMLTFTGRSFWPLDPRADEVCIEDIAHALAAVSRFGGHTKEAYSVAQHSIFVAALVERDHPHLALHALLHDAAEAYLGDAIRAFKTYLFFACEDRSPESFGTAEQRVMGAIHQAFGLRDLDFIERATIKLADNVALATEARDLMGDPRWPGLPDPVAELTVPVDAWVAERAFLAMFKRLRP